MSFARTSCFGSASSLAFCSRDCAYAQLRCARSLALGVLGKLDVQATATGRLVVSGRSQVIQSYEQSRLLSIHVRDGQRVEKGAPLLTLDTLGVNQDITRLVSQAEFQTNELIRYRTLLNDQLLTHDPMFTALPAEQQALIHENYLSEKTNSTQRWQASPPR